MNTLQTIWSALTTPNTTLTNILGIPLMFLDLTVCMLFFSTILNIQSTKRQKITYVLVLGVIANIANFIIPASYKIFFNMIVWPIAIFFILKTTILKSFLAEAIILVTTSVLESIFINILHLLFNLSYNDIAQTPIYRLICVISIYLIIFLLTKVIKYFKININIIDNLPTKSKVLLGVSILLTISVIIFQFILLMFYNTIMPTIVSIVNILILIIYFSISICSIINISKLASTKQDLESANLTINSLSILHDNVRSFKHDFDNIVNSIGGYVVNEDMEGLKKYYNQLLEECNKTNNLYALSPKVINHPAIYHMLATKYYEADKENVTINLNVFLDLNEIETRMKIYDFTRILGILLDNAIEAAKVCKKKVINVTFRKEISNDMIVVIIQNTYTNKDVDTEDIYKKGVSSKENHSGLGLWKIRQILMRNNNLNLFTSKDDEYFTQQFEIFK